MSAVNGEQVRELGFEVAVEALDPGLIGGVPGRPKYWAIAHNTMNSRVDPEVIFGSLSDTGEQDRLADVV
jgi:hypothetical protein